MLSDPTRQIAYGCFVCTIYYVFTVFPVLTQAASCGERANTGKVLVLQGQVHSAVNPFGLFFLRDLRFGCFGLVAYKELNGLMVILGILIVRLEIS